MSKRNIFDGWEQDFIRLAYPLSSQKQMSDYLNRKISTINTFCVSRKIINTICKIEIGDRFGDLLVIKFDENKRDTKTKRRRWICLCKCGKESSISTSTLLSGHSTSCGCVRLEKIYKGFKYIPGWYFGNIKSQAKTRKLEFNITIEYINELLVNQDFKCKLTKLPIIIREYRHKNNNMPSTASLDRIDSSKGYQIDNVQWIHTDINFMKGIYEQDYFINMCKLVAGSSASQEFIDNIINNPATNILTPSYSQIRNKVNKWVKEE